MRRRPRASTAIVQTAWRDASATRRGGRVDRALTRVLRPGQNVTSGDKSTSTLTLAVGSRCSDAMTDGAMTTNTGANAQQATTSEGFVVVGVDGTPEAVHALAWAADYAAARDLSIEVITTWSFPAVGIELPSTGRVLHKHAIETARHATELVAADRAAADEPVPAMHVEAYLAHPVERLSLASQGAQLLVVGRGRRSVLGSTSRGVTDHATCPVAVIPSPDDREAPSSLTARLATDHPQLTAAIEAVSQHLSAMGI